MKKEAIDFRILKECFGVARFVRLLIFTREFFVKHPLKFSKIIVSFVEFLAEKRIDVKEFPIVKSGNSWWRFHRILISVVGTSVRQQFEVREEDLLAKPRRWLTSRCGDLYPPCILTSHSELLQFNVFEVIMK
jgi:hypothetical protein